jgi:hypothetical protein
MKTLNPTTLIAAVIMYASVTGCEKEINKPIPPTPRPLPTRTTDVVTNSNWFFIHWVYTDWPGVMQYIKYVPELNSNLLTSGRVLVFGKDELDMESPKALPASFGATFIGVKAEVGDLKFVLRGPNAVSNLQQFKYILIPASKLAHDLDYSDYHAVCTYYKIPE